MATPPTSRSASTGASDRTPHRSAASGWVDRDPHPRRIQEWVDDGAGGGRRLVDPLVGPVIEHLRATGDRPVVIGMGLDHRDPAHAATIAADDDLLPASLLMTEWPPRAIRTRRYRGGRHPPSLDVRQVRRRRCRSQRAAPGTEIERLLRTVVATSIRQVPRVGRLLASLRPRAIVLTHEGIRTPWIIAARRAGIPVHAIQHGVLYPTHPGYRHPRSPAWPLPDTTFVFGRYERAVLLDVGGYLEEEVEVSGSPRVVDLLPVLAEDDARIRAELGVREGDRLVLVSTIFRPSADATC